MKARGEVIELDMQELEEIIERSRHGTLSAQDQEKLKELLGAMKHLMALVENNKTSMRKLRQMLFGASTEKLENLKKVLEVAAEAEALGSKEHRAQGKQKAKGHGRNGADAYRGAERIKIEHESLKTGDRCPGCEKGKVYVPGSPAYRIRIKGQAPIGATVYELEKLRCNLCGEMFTAKAPEGVGEEKYDASSVSMVALLKYGCGFPFHRLEGLQESMEIPLPASTQWEMVSEKVPLLEPAYEELIRQAAQGEVLHNDDTTMKVLALMRDKNREIDKKADERSGVFTSGIVATQAGQKIALFFTGHRHAGENLAEVLKRRASHLGPPIQMCDALSRNLPKDFDVVLAHCNAHARRHFVDVAPSFPQECRYVLEILAEVYQNDAHTREAGMSAEERLHFHQQKSAPLMEGLKQWLTAQLDEHKVEPNSGLGSAISYFLKHFDKLTLFLRVAGAPLDNNAAERGLKKAILHRKASLFYKTENGAYVGDLYMSLIYSCQLAKVNPFEYLTELKRHHQELVRQPEDWMPWNYRQILERAVPSGRPPPYSSC
jgi:transposase